jgi:hypothetical protein
MNPVEALVAALSSRAPRWHKGQSPVTQPNYVPAPAAGFDPRMLRVTPESLAANEAVRLRRLKLLRLGARDPADTGGTI